MRPGHPSRLNRPTPNNHDGLGSEAYAREGLRAEIAAMMSGEKLGVGHEPRHGTAYVSSWIKALESDPREIRPAAVDAQRMSDWLLARERDRSQVEGRAESGDLTAVRQCPHNRSVKPSRPGIRIRSSAMHPGRRWG